MEPATPTHVALDGRPSGPLDGHARWSLYGPVAREMALVEAQLRRELRSRFNELQPVVQHGALLGGKRLRPGLVLLAGAATGPLGPDHVTLAAVMEILHTATLVHDDLLDAALMRRHVPTVNARWSGQVSILLGDFLFAHSFYLAATLGSTEACRLIGQAARGVCEGEMRQVLRAGDAAVDEATYLELIRGKTAELTRVSCLLGGRLSGASASEIDALARYGTSLGIAFQIADDYLDLWGEDDSTGKTLGSDLGQGKATLPLIRFLATTTPADREYALQILRGPSAGRAAALRPLIDQSDARDYTLDRARAFVNGGVEALGELRPSPARRTLEELAHFAILRSA